MVLAAVAAVVDTAAVAVAAATVVAAAVAAMVVVVAADAATVAEAAVVVEAAVDVVLIAITKPISRSLNRFKYKSGGKCLRFFCLLGSITRFQYTHRSQRDAGQSIA
jgi:uncharacterized membrane protein